MAIADSGASHVILPQSALFDSKSAKPVNLRLAAGEIQAVEAHREIFAEHVTIPLCPLGRVIRKLQLTAIWTPQTLTLNCVNKAGTAQGLMQCPIKGDTPYFAAVHFWTSDPGCLKVRRTPGEPESFSDKPHDKPHAQKARVKRPSLQPGQDPLDHTPVLRLVGVLLWVSLRTRPDISWAVARITRLATSDEARARVCVCIRHVTQCLRWTLHFALFYEPVQDLKWHCYTDASWAPEETIVTKLSQST